MEMSQSQVLPVTQDIAWQALNDPDVLRQCIPGCESVERTGENAFAVAMVAAIGPVKAKFRGTLQIENPEPPRAYTLAFNGQGGAAGFGKGTAQVTLTPSTADGADVAQGALTRLDYTAQAQVGGKIAQIGSRLVDGAARKLAADFFAAFDALLRERYPAEAAAAALAVASTGLGGEIGGVDAARASADLTGGDPIHTPDLSDAAGPGAAAASLQAGTGEGPDEAASMRPLSALNAGASRASHASARRSKRPWVWGVIVIIAALVIAYVTRTH